MEKNIHALEFGFCLGGQAFRFICESLYLPRIHKVAGRYKSWAGSQFIEVSTVGIRSTDTTCTNYLLLYSRAESFRGAVEEL